MWRDGFPNNFETLCNYMRYKDPLINLVELKKVSEVFQEHIKMLSKIPKETFKNLAKIQEETRKAFEPLTKAWIELAQRTQQFIEYSKETIEEAGKILLSLGWWIHPDWTIPSLRDIINAHKKGKDKEIEKAIIDYFNEQKLNKIQKNWKSNAKIKSRIHILEDAIWAHKQSKYTLSVPALLPQVEGIVIENSGKKGKIIGYEKIVKIFKQRLGKELDEKKVSFMLSFPVFKFVEGLLTENFKWGQKERPKVARTPILHGFFVNYDTQSFSLKLILLIDFIQNLIKSDKNTDKKRQS